MITRLTCLLQKRKRVLHDLLCAFVALCFNHFVPVLMGTAALMAHPDCSEEAFTQFLRENASLEDQILFDSLKEASEQGTVLMDCSSEEKEGGEKFFSQSLPEWATGGEEEVNLYHHLHRETFVDRFFGEIACRLGVIIHGKMSQEQLDARLSSFNIERLLATGPDPKANLSLAAQQLIFDSLQLPKIYDIHLHLHGYDEDNYLNPKAAARGVAPWLDYFKFVVIRYAAGISSSRGSTEAARKRMQSYVAHFPGCHGVILPVHAAFEPSGQADWSNTGSYLTNEAAWKTAETFHSDNSRLLAAVSIHPFDREWKRKMVEAYSRGIRLIKWMPPQSIPPDSPELDEYYQMMRSYRMVLIAHAGPEHTIPTNENNKKWVDWGNPLRFRRPLQLGVNVILAHCGHKDSIPDLDNHEQPLTPGFQLFLRLAREAHQKNQTGEWEGKLYGDLSAVLAHYGVDFVRELLLCSREEGVRFIYGSDYPLTNLVQPGKDAFDECAKGGLLDPVKVKPLKEIRQWNPLLANYVFARNLVLETAEGPISFPEKVFSGETFEAAFY